MGRRRADGQRSKRGKAQNSRVEFDESDRKEYLTGFHKRKQLRRKQAAVEKKQKGRSKLLKQRKEFRNALQKGVVSSEKSKDVVADNASPDPQPPQPSTASSVAEYGGIRVSVVQPDLGGK